MTDEEPTRSAPPEAHAVSPRFAEYTDRLLFGEVWQRPGLSMRDKSMLTCSVLIALNRSQYLSFHARRALDNGLSPRELSEIVTQLAVYCGWPMASAAVSELAPVYAERGIGAEDVAPEPVPPLDADPGMELRRKAVLDASIGAVSPDLARYSNELLFGDLWLHPELAPRDRSLVTLAAIWAMGLQPLLDYQYRRAFDNGVTRDEISDALVHCAFYVGWPRAMAAAMVAREVLVGDDGEDHA
ncbi:carboxymuconolactone decarboxylase family protein [Amaricoccus sp. W119]|uniref:carboxymuconolactone decarboxylase family protein n=1 Tax=Amaricoccus sp. W119 TaxID=3391833 RepID=UPI0039A49207